jgi:hypothetical protein
MASTRILSIATLLWVTSALPAQRTADEVLTEMGFSAAQKQRVLKGEFVSADIGAVSERDLAFAVAFLVKASPEELGKRVLEGALLTADAQVRAFGKLTEYGGLADFAGLRISDEEARALSSAGPADGMNASAAELASLRALRGQPTKAVEEQLHKMLLARYQAYRTSGLGGIVSYERGGGRVGDVASDLTKASHSATACQKHMPSLFAFLLDYPRGAPPGLQENFLWVKSVIREKPTYVLAHIFSAGDGDARAVVRREFYVSTGYEAEQSIGGFLPVTGGTIVLSMSHAFSDQVAGTGSSMKRSIGSRIMAGQMKEIFDKGRKLIE